MDGNYDIDLNIPMDAEDENYDFDLNIPVDAEENVSPQGSQHFTEGEDTASQCEGKFTRNQIDWSELFGVEISLEKKKFCLIFMVDQPMRIMKEKEIQRRT